MNPDGPIVPIAELYEPMERTAGCALPYCRDHLERFNGIALQGTAEATIFYLGMALTKARPHGQPRLPLLDDIVDAPTMARAIVNVAKVIAEPEADAASLDAAVTYILAFILTANGGHHRATSGYDLFWFDSQARWLAKMVSEVSTKEELDRLLQRAAEVNQRFHAQRGESLFKYFPCSMEQAWLLRHDPESHELRSCVISRLVKMHADGGQFVRQDRVVNRLIAVERAKLERRDRQRHDFSLAIKNLLGQLGLPRKADVSILHRGNAVPTLRQSRGCAVEVTIDPAVPNTFVIYVSGAGVSSKQSIVVNLVDLLMRRHVE